MLSRTDWGADETLRYTADGTEIWPPEYYPVQTLTVVLKVWLKAWVNRPTPTAA